MEFHEFFYKFRDLNFLVNFLNLFPESLSFILVCETVPNRFFNDFKYLFNNVLMHSFPGFPAFDFSVDNGQFLGSRCGRKHWTWLCRLKLKCRNGLGIKIVLRLSRFLQFFNDYSLTLFCLEVDFHCLGPFQVIKTSFKTWYSG
jgi:hypothetical protein